MDRISLLSDDLLLKILSFAPTKDVLTTSLLSKRWTSLWKHVPKLEYVDINTNRTLHFVEKFLQLNKTPVLETLHLTLGKHVPHVDIRKWVSVAISRGVRNLKFVQYRPRSGPVQFPRNMYTCRSLVDLYLHQVEIADIPSETNFPSLKNLTLSFVNFSSDEIFRTLLSSCPVLEELVVYRSWDNDGVRNFTIAVPWLQRLVIYEFSDDPRYPGDCIGFVINAPSLKSIKIFERISRFCSLVEMPELVEAEIDLRHSDSEKLLRCVTSVKHLSLCSKRQMDRNITGNFNQLVSLELCSKCTSDWLNLILQNSPNLRTLRFRQKYCCNSSRDVQMKWEQPSFVPNCLISSLKTVEWIGYRGTEEEKEIVIYLLANGSFLNKMIIKPPLFTILEENNRWLMEIESKPKSSSKCLLSFTA